MKIGILFPGYGSQFIGMAKELYDESRVVQEYFEEASNCLDTNFVKLCFASSDTELSRMDNAYAAIFLISSALFALLKERGIVPHKVAGHNQGEFAAAYAVGGFTFPDGLYLLSKYATHYAELLSTIDANGIRVSGIAFEQLNDLCHKITRGDRWAQVALQNTQTEHVVMGHPEAIELVRERVIDHPEVEIDDADVELGLHTPLMEPVVTTLTMYCEKVDFKDLSAPLITNVDAKAVTQGDEVKIALMKQVQSCVRWADCMGAFADCSLILEMGPGAQLSTIIKKLYPDKHCLAINTKQDVEQLEHIISSDTVQGI